MFASRGGFLAQPTAAGGSSLFVPKTASGTNARVFCTPNTDVVQWYRSGGWTLEYWIYVPVMADLPSANWSGPGNHNGSGIDYWTSYVNADGSVAFYAFPIGTMTTTTGIITAGQWFSIAISSQRLGTNSNRVRLFVNGTVRLTNDWADGQSATGTPFSIGPRATINASSGTYYIDELRISSNTRYTANYTPATAPFTSDANTTMLLSMTGANDSTTITDSGPNNFTFTNLVTTPRCVISTAQFKF